MQTDASERGVGDGGAAKGEFERSEVRTAEGENFGCGVGEGAAKGLLFTLAFFVHSMETKDKERLTKSNSLNPFAAFVKYTIALSVR